MPSSSDGPAFAQVLPGASTAGLQSLGVFEYKEERWVAYISGSSVNILVGPEKVVQSFTVGDGAEHLSGLVAEEKTGKIAVATRDAVLIYEAISEGWESVAWEHTLTLSLPEEAEGIRSLSWGSGGELLVASSSLTLCNTLPPSRKATPISSPIESSSVEIRSPLWARQLPSPAQHALFSPSASLIATAGARDTLVKIWRRLSFEDAQFDYAYLPHTSAVTWVQWRREDEDGTEGRRPSDAVGGHGEKPEVLYTLAMDSVLKVWKTGAHHDTDIMSLYTSINLVSAIPSSPAVQPRVATAQTQRPARYAFVLPAVTFSRAISTAISTSTAAKTSHSLEHLREVASRFPDIIVTLDSSGRMSAWGIENVGCKKRSSGMVAKEPFHIAHAEGLLLHLGVTTVRFECWFDGGNLQVLCHDFSGKVGWWKGGVEAFFSPSAPGSGRITQLSTWTGHSAPIIGIRSCFHGRSLVSWAVDTKGDDEVVSEVCTWTLNPTGILERTSTFTAGSKPVDDALLIQDGRFALLLHDRHLQLWDLYQSPPAMVTDTAEALDSTGAGSRITLLSASEAQSNGEDNDCSVVVTTTGRLGSVFMITLSADEPEVHFQRTFSLIGAAQWPTAVMVPRAGSGVDKALTFSNESELLCYDLPQSRDSAHVDVNKNRRIPTAHKSLETMYANAHVAALVSSNALQISIFELKDGYHEHDINLSHPVRDIALSTTIEGFTLLAIAHGAVVEIWVETSHASAESPGWCIVKTIMLKHGHAATGLAWLKRGKLVVASGNGLLLPLATVDLDTLPEGLQPWIRTATSSRNVALDDLVRQLNAPKPIWHPSVLQMLVQHVSLDTVKMVLRRLHEKLRFWSEGDHLDALPDILVRDLLKSQPMSSPVSEEELNIGALLNLLREKVLPRLSPTVQAHLQAVVKAVAEDFEKQGSVDVLALRYLFAHRLAVLLREEKLDVQLEYQLENRLVGRTNGHTRPTAPPAIWRDIIFAYHSTSQASLLETIVQAHDNKLTWSLVKSSGLMYWLSDQSALESVLETVAQQAYRSASPADPVNATLYYLALRRKQTLLQLWRIATWHREAKTTLNFLKRDFAVPRNRTAAKKNAYALMGKRRFEYASAFFLLADDLQSCVSVLASQCGDVGLAVMVVRCYDGDNSPVLEKLLKERLRPEGDRWCRSWCCSILGEQREALSSLVEPPNVDNKKVRSWHDDDPVTLCLYSYMRGEKGGLGAELEYAAVARAIRVLRRVGLHIVALELVGAWQFMPAARVDERQLRISPAELSNEVLSEPNGAAATPRTANGAPSILDHFTTTNLTPVKAKEGPPSMLDSFTNPAPTAPATSPPPSTATDEKAEREKKAAEMLAKMKAKKAGAIAEDGVMDEKKVQREPTQFKEPDANSLLESFGF